MLSVTWSCLVNSYSNYTLLPVQHLIIKAQRWLCLSNLMTIISSTIINTRINALLLIKKRWRESSNVNINMFIFWIIFILKLPRKCLLAKKKSWCYTLYHLKSIQPLNRVLRILVEFISIDLLPAHPNDILVKVQTIHYY